MIQPNKKYVNRIAQRYNNKRKTNNQSKKSNTSTAAAVGEKKIVINKDLQYVAASKSQIPILHFDYNASNGPQLTEGCALSKDEKEEGTVSGPHTGENTAALPFYHKS